MDQIKISEYIPGSIGKITELHAAYYSNHWNFGLFFERKVATELSEFLGRFNANRDGFWIANFAGNIIGSITIDGICSETKGAHLRWFIVSQEHQGLGTGKLLLKKGIEFSKKCDFKRIYLWTFSGLNVARHLYEKYGFKLCKEQINNQWGVTVKEQMFELILRD
ncbi:MAG: GNAT family N-acetyltransferase [Desulfobacterales bacterium]|nr:GNAT family N-acetyltransferase [Desulfobacterales bacterium]